MIRRNTKQKQIVLDAVKGRCDHPTAEQLYEDVKKADPNISMGTLYRNLSILAQENKIQNIRMSNADRYDLRLDKHTHFVCEKCGKVYDIGIMYDDSNDNQKTKDGFLIKNHQTIFNGICPECLKKN